MGRIKSIALLQKGKQIGFEEIREKINVKIYFCVAVQKWEGKYKIYQMELEEDKFSLFFEGLAEETEKIIQVDTIEKVLHYFDKVLHIDIEKLHPLKGQKIFYPEF